MTITPGKVFYTDGHEVTVTDSAFQVKNTRYHLNGITKHGFLTIVPDRLPALLVMVVGAMALTLGFFRLIPPGSFRDVEIGRVIITPDGIAVGVGILLMLAGLLIMGLVRERYAVRIATAEGEKNVVVSKSKPYITQIVDALNKAIRNVVEGQSRRKKD